MKLYIIENVKNMYFEKNHGISVCNNTVVPVLCGNPWAKQVSLHTREIVVLGLKKSGSISYCLDSC